MKEKWSSHQNILNHKDPLLWLIGYNVPINEGDRQPTKMLLDL